jgi:aryl-alcohol dehydrogenase-like predicted oxidoreductase
MQSRILGRTGLHVSVLAFGAGPVSGLMTGDDAGAQQAAIGAALAAGINWFDTAPGYGQGRSETHLGRALGQADAHVATKVRLPAEHLDAPADYVRRSVAESLQRLGRARVTLLQLHNGITVRRGDEPTSLTPADAFAVRDAFERLRNEGLVEWLGLTGIGQPAALHAVLRSGAFDTMQVPYHLLNPSAGGGAAPPGETDYGNVIADAADQGMGVLAIRVFAGGALLGHPPSAHTLRTPFFPLDLYERDRHQAEQLAAAGDVKGRALRFALDHPSVHAAIVGFGSAAEVEEAVRLVA